MLVSKRIISIIFKSSFPIKLLLKVTFIQDVSKLLVELVLLWETDRTQLRQAKVAT